MVPLACGLELVRIAAIQSYFLSTGPARVDAAMGLIIYEALEANLGQKK
jgi:hypothetical protein